MDMQELPNQDLRKRIDELEAELSKNRRNINVDHTEKEINETLKNSEEQFKSLFDNMQNGCAIHEMIFDEEGLAEDYIFLDINDAFEKQTNLKREDVIGKKVTEVIPGIEDDPFDWIGIYGKVVVSGESAAFENYAAPLKKWYSVVAFRLKSNRFAVVFLDVTARKLIEKELRRSEEKLKALFSSMTEMVVLHDLVYNDDDDVVDYRIIDCNNAYTKITGITRETAIGKLATEVYQSDPPPYLKEFTAVGITGESYEYTTYYAPMDKHFLISAVSPRKGQFATITTDITAIKQIEEVVKAKNEELENYLYVASHDLRSPLVNIQGFSQRLEKQVNLIKEKVNKSNIDNELKKELEEITNKNIPKTLDFIFTNVSKMDTLISGLLQISRTGRTKMIIREIDMNKLIEKVIKAHDFQIEKFNAVTNIRELPNCYGDENMLNTLFSNIISNAFKYRDKERRLTISIDGEVRFSKVIYKVQDNGIGIAQRHLKKIWDVFYQVDPQYAESGEGLGLSIVKRIIDKHRGKITVESKEGQGTIFFIELLNKNFTE